MDSYKSCGDCVVDRGGLRAVFCSRKTCHFIVIFLKDICRARGISFEEVGPTGQVVEPLNFSGQLSDGRSRSS
jgi:hypothetical protein